MGIGRRWGRRKPVTRLMEVDQGVAFVGQFHVDEDITGHKAAFCGDFFTAAHFDHFFGGDQHFVDLVLKAVFLGRGPDGFRDLLFEV